MTCDPFQLIRREGTNVVAALSSVADVNVRDDDGLSLLHMAIAWDNARAAIELIRLGINLNGQNREGFTPLHLAGVYRNVEIARAILAGDADLMLVDHHGNSALWAAVFHARGVYGVVELMMKHGAGSMVNVENRYGRSPLDFACQIEDPILIELLST